MKAKKQKNKAANVGKVALTARAMQKVKALKLAGNHNETLVRDL